MSFSETFELKMLDQLYTSLLKNSNRNSYCINGEYISYASLLKRISGIYYALKNNSIELGSNIGITTSNNIDTYAAIFAVWFYGCSYVPLNIKLPIDRNKNILKQASISTILSADGLNDLLFTENESVLVINTRALSDNTDVLHVYDRANNSLLYILFTSGSTGLPKGVPISYNNVKTFLQGYFGIGLNFEENDRFLQMFDLTFDVSVASFLVPCLVGACVYTVPSEGIKYLAVLKTIQNYKITIATIVPSILNYIQPYFNELLLPDLKVCILTAEASNRLVVDKWKDCLPNGDIFNLYGPTEATIWCTVYKSSNHENGENSYNDMLGIGKPFPTVEAAILNDDDSLVAVGEKGELCICSDQLTSGYLNNQEKNKNSFFYLNGKRFYRTGDLCKFGTNGNIVYCGRLDHQVKIQGFRIELSEIDIAAKMVFRTNSVSVAYKDRLNVTSICLYVEGQKKEYEKMEPVLRQKLPYYMLPGKIIYIDELPYNSSGKVDRLILSEKAKV